jgi:hypothetical protein
MLGPSQIHLSGMYSEYGVLGVRPKLQTSFHGHFYMPLSPPPWNPGWYPIKCSQQTFEGVKTLQ